MNQADVTKLMSALRIKYRQGHRRLSNKDGMEGRLHKMRKTVTALIKYERLEMNTQSCDEARGYAERVSVGCFIIVHTIPQFNSLVSAVNFGCDSIR